MRQHMPQSRHEPNRHRTRRHKNSRRAHGASQPRPAAATAAAGGCDGGMNMQPSPVNHLPFVKAYAATAAEICASVYLDKEALQLLRPAMEQREFLDALIEKKQY